MISAKEIAIKISIEPSFRDKRTIHRNRRCDENADNETLKIPNDCFRNDCFLYIVNQVISSLKSRLDNLRVFGLKHHQLFDFGGWHPDFHK
ncbi:MAG: hypothetical protein Q8755_03455, partial [Candidatus Phytoplasma australasiaticum]|nr:hypothetical protein [Candidatus Phytoplasma australasiaticum]